MLVNRTATQFIGPSIMRVLYKILVFVGLLLFVGSFFIKDYEKELTVFFASFFVPHSQQWKGICVKVPFNYSAAISKDNSTLIVAELETVDTDRLMINHVDLNNKEWNGVLKLYQQVKHFDIKDYKQVDIGGHPGFQMEIKDIKSNDEFIVIYIFSKNKIIEMQAKKFDDLKKFKVVLDKITFCDNRTVIGK